MFFPVFCREEGIIPYMPELPRSFEAIVNYNQSVFRLQGIHSHPAGLESTSLILAYGLGKTFFLSVLYIIAFQEVSSTVRPNYNFVLAGHLLSEAQVS